MVIYSNICAYKERFRQQKIIGLQQKPLDIALHGCWNKTTRKTELILAVAAFNRSYDINWYKIHDDLKMVRYI